LLGSFMRSSVRPSSAATSSFHGWGFGASTSSTERSPSPFLRAGPAPMLALCSLFPRSRSGRPAWEKKPG
jgi:hypothetical protein